MAIFFKTNLYHLSQIVCINIAEYSLAPPVGMVNILRKVMFVFSRSYDFVVAQPLYMAAGSFLKTPRC